MSDESQRDAPPPPTDDDANPTPVVVAVDGDDPEGLWAGIVETLGARAPAVLLLNTDAGNLEERVDSSDPPPVIVAHGANAAEAACKLPGARALVVVEGLPPESCALAKRPTMIVRGRQSDNLTHEQAVTAFERLPAGRIVELEYCGGEPQRDQPAAMATAISWFVENLAQLEAPVDAE